MQSNGHRRWSPLHPPPPVGQHARTPSTSSASSTSSVHSNPRTVNPGFTVYPNSSSSTIKIIPPTTPGTPTQSKPGRQVPRSLHSSPHAAASRPGFFEPSLSYQQSSRDPPSTADNSSTVAAAYAMQSSSQRRRATTDPSPATPPIGSPSLIGSTNPQATAAASTVYHRSESSTPAVAIPQQRPSALSAPPPLKKESSKKKIFSKPLRSATPVSDGKSLRAPPSPNKHLASALTHDARRPSYSSTSALLANIDAPSTYSSSPPTSLLSSFKDSHHHKPHFLRARRDKDHALSSSASNSKTDGASLYSFAPSSPSSSVFSLTAAKSMDPAKLDKKTHKHLYSSPFPPDDLGAADENPWLLLRTRIQPLFAGKHIMNTVEDLNRLVQLHIKYHTANSTAEQLIDDVRALLDHGMATIDPHLADVPDSQLLQRLVSIWATFFTITTPYLEAIFLPLQLELKGCGPLLSPRDAREYFAGLPPQTADIRRMIMISFRDKVVLRIRDRLRIMFSRLQLDFNKSQREMTENVGRMLQCVSVLGGCNTADDPQRLVDELAGLLKLNWLGRGRMGRNRRGFVGARVRGPQPGAVVRVP